MKQFRFREWQVYKDSQSFFLAIMNVVQKLPKEFRYDLGSQLVRSAFSIVLNIAEGGGKESDKELNRFLEIALGSLYETVAGIDTLLVAGLIDTKGQRQLNQSAESIGKQLGGFKKDLRS
jgi:four helix bundle protein